jgi:hypothetical protein
MVPYGNDKGFRDENMSHPEFFQETADKKVASG